MLKEWSQKFGVISGFLGKIIGKISDIVGSLLFALAGRVLGQHRVEAALAKITQTKKLISEKYYNSVDVESPYYRPVVATWRFFYRTLIGIVFYLFCVQTNFLWLCGSMPSVEDLQNPKVAQSSEIFTADGVMIGKFYTENRTPVAYDELSPYLVKALVATEDVRFYQHSGIDSRALFGVALGLLKGGERGGGSTITQQLSKKLFNTRRKAARGLLGYIPFLRTVIYKTKEWLTSIKLERNFSKEEILLMYFNTVDYGSNTYGIKTAAKSFFNTSPDSLKIEQAAVLVGLQKATTTYNPKTNPEKSRIRRNTVLSQMAKNGFITPKAADSLAALPLVLNENFEKPADDDASYFKNTVADYVEKWGEENGYDLYTDGLKIYTTIDSRMQAHAENATTERMKILQRLFESRWLNQNPWRDEKGEEIPNFLNDVVRRTERYKSLVKHYKNQTDSIAYHLNKKDTMTVYDWQTGGEKTVFWSSMDSLNYYKRIMRPGMVAIDPYTGQIKAWVGGLNYQFFKYDAVKQGKRQPGSTFKPFVYCAAIDSSAFNMSPCDQMRDVAFEKKYEENGEEKIWRPRNSTGRFSGQELTLRRAMARSVNSITAALTEKIGAGAVVNYAQKLGITSRLEAVPSIGLGPYDVSLYDMVAAYATFVNRGTHTDPVIVTKIEDRNGAVIEEFVPKTRQAISEESAYLMLNMLKGGIEEPGGTSQNIWTFGSLFQKGFEIGGKTGTTSNNSDGWFMGVTKDIVVGAWVGGDDRSIHFRSTNDGEGAKTALPLVGRFMELIYNDKSIGLVKGGFPKPAFKLTKDINCPSPAYTRPDTLEFEPSDSLYQLPTEENIDEPEVVAPADTIKSR